MISAAPLRSGVTGGGANFSHPPRPFLAGEVAPLAPSVDSGYVPIANPVAFGNQSVAFTARRCASYFNDFGLGKFRVTIRHPWGGVGWGPGGRLSDESDAVGMNGVFAGRYPLQVSNPVVELVPVDMVDGDGRVRSGRHERRKDKGRDGYLPESAIKPNQVNAEIPLIEDKGHNEFSAMAQRANPAQVRHLVRTPIDREPCLGDRMGFSHGEPPIQVPVVRSGLSVGALGRAALYCTAIVVLSGCQSPASRILTSANSYWYWSARWSERCAPPTEAPRTDTLCAGAPVLTRWYTALGEANAALQRGGGLPLQTAALKKVEKEARKWQK